MKKIRLFLALSLVLALVMPLLVACNDGDNGAASDGPVEITIAWWGGEARHDLFNEILDNYEYLASNVTFERQFAPWGDYWTRLITQAASDTLPDTFGMTAHHRTDFSLRGLMYPLDGFIEDGVIDVSNFTEGSLAAGQFEGQQLFITFGDTVAVLAYNRTLIDSLGMDPPSGAMTYSEFIDYLTELNEVLPDDMWPFLGAWEHQFENHVRQFGAEMVAYVDGERVLGYTPEILESYFQFAYDLLQAGLTPPAEVAAENIGRQWVDSLEGTGRIAIWQTNMNQLKIWQAQTDDALGATRGLVADNAIYRYVEQPQPSGWTVSPSSTVKYETAAFINYFVNDVDNQRLWNMELGVPGSAVIQNDIIDNLTDSLVDDTIRIEILLVSEILSNVRPHPGRLEGAPAVWTDVDNTWQEILFGLATVQEAVAAHFDRAPLILQ